MVTYGKVDACLLIVIIASVSYLYLNEDKRRHVRPDVSEISDDFDFDAETTGTSLADTSARDCKLGSSVTNSLILDYSDLSADNDIGDDILDALFTVSTDNECCSYIIDTMLHAICTFRSVLAGSCNQN